MIMKLVNLFIAFFLFVFSFALPFKLVVSFDWLYQYDIHYLHLDKQLHLSEDQILANYKTLLRYLTSAGVGELNIPGLPLSEHGLFHFEEVKRLFLIVDQILYLSGCFVFIGVLFLWRRKAKPRFLRWAGNGLLIIPIILAIPLLVSFERTFVLFHRLLFNNMYWMFDPLTDPIIYALPQEFFLHCGLAILAMTLGMAMVYHLAYFLTKKKNKGDS